MEPESMEVETSSDQFNQPYLSPNPTPPPPPPTTTLDENPLLDQPDTEEPESTTTDSSSWLPFGEKKPSSMVGAGLANLGNTCFLNAVLQCFTHTVPFVESLRSCTHPTPCCGGTEGFCIICALRDQIEHSLASSGRTIWPYKMVDNLSYISSYFQRHQQEDAHEFLQCLLDKLDTSLEMGTRDQSSSSQEKSFVKKIFGGRLRSQLRCSNCGHCSDTFEPLIDLSLEIEDVDTLLTALESFTKVEKIEETKFTCENCKEQVLVEKQFTLDQTPSVAAFHLKRFKNDGSYVEKIDKHVDYPLELDLQPYTSNKETSDVDLKYELYAIVVHVGLSSCSGHYFCFIRSSPQTWHQLDDSMVTNVSEEYVLSQEAYILFYAKQGTPWFSALMETQKQSIEKFDATTSPKSVLDDVDSVCTTYPVCASKFKGNVVEARDDDWRISTALPINNCSIGVTKDRHVGDFMKPGREDDVLQDGSGVNVMKNRNDANVVKARHEENTLKDGNDVDVCPRTPPPRSPSPDLYADEPPVSFSIPRDHLKLKNQALLNKQANKALEDSKRKEALRLTRSMPSSRAMKLKAYIQGPPTESSINKKKRKMDFSRDADSDRKKTSSGACRKQNPSILHTVAAVDFSG